jgi:hypothetical protein
LLERFLAPVRASAPRSAWEAELAVGQALSQQEAVALLRLGPARHARLTQQSLRLRAFQ